MPRREFNFSGRGNFLNGQFFKPHPINGEFISRNPGEFSDEIGKIEYSYSSVHDAVHSAKLAFANWRRLSFQERSEYLKRYQSILKRREGELAELIAREVGKPLWEAQTELTAMMNKVDITISESMRFIADFELTKLPDHVAGVCRYRPLGVMAVIGPFNFPGHLPNGHIVPALLTGNTIVFKPSEKAPIVGQVMAECFQEAGFPPGVFNMIQGEKEVGRRLCVHEEVNGILFTGSYEVGTRIKQDTLQQHWKLLVLEMGGKNSAIIWSDAQMDLAVFEVLSGAFLTAGQRCSATSRVIVHHQVLDEFISRFHTRSKAFSIGHPLDNPFMGPLIDQGSVDRYMKFLGIATREGCESVMRGKTLELSTQGNYVTPSICWAKDASIEQARKSIYQQTELFAPNVVILSVHEVEEAIALANVTQYGLVASVFTQNRSIYEKFWDGLEMGLINWNKSTIGASSRLPFGGFKKSGNHFPTALTATTYCAAPVSSLEVAEPPAIESVVAKTPGLNWTK